MPKAINLYNLFKTKFKTLKLGAPWDTLIGNPEQRGTWFILGAPKNGKTSFALQLCKLMSKFSRVIYNSIEEGLSLSFRDAVSRSEMQEVGNRFKLGDKWTIEELSEVLRKKNSPNFIVIDSIQFAGLKFSQYKSLKEEFPHKIFCYISHVKGKEADGNVAKSIYRDANVICRVEGFRAFITSRYGGEGYFDINPEMAQAYWNDVKTDL